MWPTICTLTLLVIAFPMALPHLCCPILIHPLWLGFCGPRHSASPWCGSWDFGEVAYKHIPQCQMTVVSQCSVWARKTCIHGHWCVSTYTLCSHTDTWIWKGCRGEGCGGHITRCDFKPFIRALLRIIIIYPYNCLCSPYYVLCLKKNQKNWQ